ncbi:MAG: hypothetical protein M1821_002395 [Bathelium mastoideum]|nr:MAG: hypothetical protein M1821_002395 [Bathelium mastoideum]KAI9686395.1 MAG: hypothetical protein M1822_003740 [Bathelium mastoideum]
MLAAANTRYYEIPMSLLERDPDIAQPAKQTRRKRPARLKRPLIQDELDAVDPHHSKRIRFVAQNDHDGDGINATEENAADNKKTDGYTSKRSIWKKHKHTLWPEESQEPRTPVYSIERANRGRNFIEIKFEQQAQSAQSAQGSNHGTFRKRDKLTTSDQALYQRQDDAQVFPSAGAKPETVVQRFEELHDLIKSFITKWYSFDRRATLHGRSLTDQRPLEILRRESSTELKCLITCHASGGPARVSGWDDLFKDKDGREAILYGIIMKALEEHIFGELLFGCDTEQKTHLEHQEANLAEDDGFERTKLRAEYITQSLRRPNGKKALTYPPKYRTQVDIISIQLYTLIRALLLLNPDRTCLPLPKSHAGDAKSDNGLYYHERPQEAEQYRVLMDLRIIVQSAAMTSLLIRLCSDTTFHFQPVFKNTLFLPDVMDAWDPSYIRDGDPQNKGNELSEPYRALHRKCNPVVQVICSPSILMFRKGGPVGLKDAEETGLRVKTLRKALVSVRWGKQRAITPKSNDGYLEFDAALDMASKIYNESDAAYERQDQEAADQQIRDDVRGSRPRRNQDYSCVVM